MSLTPPLVAGEMRLVLTWGVEPQDLDAHLWLPSQTPYHLSFSRKGSLTACPFARLDVDETAGFGPETVTLSQRFVGSYLFAVHQFSASGQLTASQAQVQVFNSSGLIGTFNVPTTGAGFWWRVLSIDGLTGNVTGINQLGGDPAPYPDTGSGCVGPASVLAAGHGLSEPVPLASASPSSTPTSSEPVAALQMAGPPDAPASRRRPGRWA